MELGRPLMIGSVVELNPLVEEAARITCSVIEDTRATRHRQDHLFSQFFGDDMTISTTEVFDLDNRIVHEVERHWNERGVPILLSQLGTKDGGDIARKAREQAGGLAAYIRSQLAHQIRVVQHSSNSVVVGAIPTSVDEDSITNFDALLSRTQTGLSQGAMRFHPAFWAAFRKPLEETKRRYMKSRAPLHFMDTTLEERPEHVIEVQREHILGPEAENADVVRQIQAWLKANEGEVEPALYRSEERSGIQRFPADDLLGRILRTLDHEDLRRISLPLDIVSKLRRQSL